MEETKLRQLFKNRADAYLNTIDESVEQGMSEDCFIKAVNEAINYTRCCKSDSEQLDADFISIVGKEAHFYKDGKIFKKEKLKFSD